MNLKVTDYAVLALLAVNAAISTALVTHVGGFDLPPAVMFVLAVALSPLATVIAVLPGLGVHVPVKGEPPVA